MEQHLNHHQRDTLELLFRHSSHNVRWTDILHLLEAMAVIEERHDGHYKVTIGEETVFVERPRGKDVDTDLLVTLRRMFTHAGLAPAQSPERGPEAPAS